MQINSYAHMPYVTKRHQWEDFSPLTCTNSNGATPIIYSFVYLLFIYIFTYLCLKVHQLYLVKGRKNILGVFLIIAPKFPPHFSLGKYFSTVRRMTLFLTATNDRRPVPSECYLKGS